jgi:hypothetical protein
VKVAKIEDERFSRLRQVEVPPLQLLLAVGVVVVRVAA